MLPERSRRTLPAPTGSGFEKRSFQRSWQRGRPRPLLWRSCLLRRKDSGAWNVEPPLWLLHSERPVSMNHSILLARRVDQMCSAFVAFFQSLYSSKHTVPSSCRGVTFILSDVFCVSSFLAAFFHLCCWGQTERECLPRL